MPFALPDAAWRYCVIGDPVAHSVSPAMQNAAFAAAGRQERYGRFHVRPEELRDFCAFARTHLDGFNATVPHKSALLPLLDEVAPEARAAGSVNTVTVRAGRLCGDSTDGYGLETALREAFGLTLPGSSVLLLGAGGAARAAAFALAHRGAKNIVIVNRTLAHAEALAEELRRAFSAEITVAASSDKEQIKRFASQAGVVIQATSSGLNPADAPPVAPECLKDAKAYFDMIYRKTPLLAYVRQCGIPAADGRLMLLHQGAKSWSLWTGDAAPLDAMRQALDAALPPNP